MSIFKPTKVYISHNRNIWFYRTGIALFNTKQTYLHHFSYFCNMIQPSFPYNTTGYTDMREMRYKTFATEGCLMILCVRGEAELYINSQSQKFKRNDFLIFTNDIYLSVKNISPDFKIRYLSLPETLLDYAYYKIFNPSFWHHMHQNPVIRFSSGHLTLISGWIDQAEWILCHMSISAGQEMMRNNVFNLFYALENELSRYYTTQPQDNKNRGWGILTQFMSLVSQHARTHRNVEFYAEKLHITPDYLYKICRNIFGISSKNLIEQQTIVEIKILLSDTDMSIKNIAQTLNFEESSYLCRFFKKHTGMSPIAFRNKHNPSHRQPT